MSKGKRLAAGRRAPAVSSDDAARSRFVPFLSRLSPVFVFSCDGDDIPEQRKDTDGRAERVPPYRSGTTTREGSESGCGRRLHLIAQNESAAALTDAEVRTEGADLSSSSPAADPQISGLLHACLETRAPARRDVVWRAIATGEERLMSLTAEFVAPGAVVLSAEDRGGEGESRRKLAVMHALSELSAGCASRGALITQALRLLRGYIGSEDVGFREASPEEARSERPGAREIPVGSRGVLLGFLRLPDGGAAAGTGGPNGEFLETLGLLLGEALGRLDRERARRDIETYLRVLTESAESAVVFLDADGRITRWNPAAEQMYGYSAAEVLGKSCSLLYSAEDAARGKPDEDLRAARERGSLRAEEATRRRKDGELFVVGVRMSVLRDEEGRVLGYSRIARDVTERKRSEIVLHRNLAALDKRVRELRCLYEVAALISDPAMPLSSVMQNVAELVARAYQYPAITCVRIRVGEHVYETDGFVETEWEQTSTIGTLSSHLGTLQVCYREARPDVDEGPFSEEERDLIESIGQLLGDFLERRSTAGALRRTNALLETLFASTNYKIAFLDSSFRYIRVNDAYARSWGNDAQSYVGTSHFELFPDDEEIFRRVLRTGTPYMAADKARELPGEHAGQPRFWDWELFPMSGEGVEEAGLVLILVDRTRRHRALKEVEGSREELRQLASHLQELREDERRTIAREIHDELGGLLTALKMEISLLGKSETPFTRACLESYDSAIELIDQSISMIQRITSDLRPRILDDFGLVAAIEWHIKDFQKRSGIACSLKIGTGSYIMEKNRTAAVFRILQESLTNVVRHARATRVFISLRKLGGRLLMRVADNGVGIDDSRVTAATSYGLMGIRERAQSLGGQVSISGRKGRGTTLSLEIPLPREEAQ